MRPIQQQLSSRFSGEEAPPKGSGGTRKSKAAIRDTVDETVRRFESQQLEECYQRLDAGEQEIVGAVFSW